MKRGTLTLLNSGPSGGKTTILAQAAKAYLSQEPFFIKGLDFPEGKIAWVQSDRKASLYDPIFEATGILGHPDLYTINFADDTTLHAMTRPVPPKEEVGQLESLRDAISRRIAGKGISTVILDLYITFQTDPNNTKKAAYDGRENLRWADKLNVALIGVNYTFKQTTSKQAMRLQDRNAGSLMGQASANWKFSITRRTTEG